MKKTLSLVLALALVVGLFAACGSSSSAESSNTEESTANVETESTVSEPEEAEPAQAESDEPEQQAEADEQEPDEDIVLQPKVNENTAAILAEAAEAAGAVPSEDVPDEEKTELWLTIESDEYASGMASIRAQKTDQVLPTSETNYDENGNLLSCNGAPYEYPLDDGHSISIFAVSRGLISNYITDSYDELISFQMASSETNISVDWTVVPNDAATEQMSLIFAGGDYPDVVSDFLYSYSGTPSSAYDDDLILDLCDYLEEYSPNYNAWLDSETEYRKSVSDDDGHILGYYVLNPVKSIEQSGWVRTDLLDAFGLDEPVTLDEYETYFDMCVASGMTATISAGIYSWASVATSAFDLPSLVEADGFGPALYHIGDTICSAYYADTILEYLTLMHDWYERGYFTKDIVSFTGTDGDNELNELTYNGNVGYLTSGTGHYTNYVESASVEGFDLTPVHNIVRQEGDVTHFKTSGSIGSSSAVITTNCKDIEAACRYMDWFYTDLGVETLNYGPEGVTWNWSEDGQTRLFTAALYEDTVWDLNPGPVSMMYTGSTAWVTVGDCYCNLYYSGSLKAIEALDIWSEDNDSEYYLNTDLLSLTTEENEMIAETLSDIDTYLSENMVKFLIGDNDLSEWDEFINTIDGMGMQDIIEIYQDAYDRYLKR